ncbi:hypothetical protein C0V97_04860 [Asaia sp. W19]|uniref:M48 family metallopeptidase n=1 Tax=unclassified Asaia TaxID=2685023 RepID=UPI000F8D6CB0|nr:M48 family metallopeptidase [Asaia sp. W19]RUT26649.1 hypothetical protein C0V97_04860 [Asaia sp. W19]
MMYAPSRPLAALLSLLTLNACAGEGGSGIPTSGRLIDQTHPPQDYAQATTVQGLLSPANTLASGVIEAPQVSAYPQEIVDRLLNGWSGPKPDARVWLTPDMAFTSDVSVGGAIFLNTGLIRYFHDTPDIQKEDALAFVLAHELSHILLGHTAAQRASKARKDYAFSAMKWGSVIGRFAAGSGAAGDVSRAIVSSMGAKAFLDTTLFPSWSRDQEEQADALAVDLMARAGYAVSAATDVMDVLISSEDQEMQRQAQDEQKTGKSFVADSVTFQAKAGDGLDGAIVDALRAVAQQHPHARERRVALAAYLRQAYPVRAHVALERRPLQQWESSRPVAALLKGTEQLNQAAVQIKSAQWGQARQTLAHVAQPASGSAYYALMAYQVSTQTGQKAQGVKLLSAAAQRDDVTFPIATEWGMALTSAGKYNEAETYMATEQTAMNNTSFLPYRITNARKAKDEVNAFKLSAICEGLGEDALAKQCSAVEKN